MKTFLDFSNQISSGILDYLMLHLAAVHGWIDTVIDLITKNNWNTNC